MGSFDRIHNGLNNLDSHAAISAEDWLELLSSVNRAVFAHNGIGSGAGMRPSGDEKRLYCLSRLTAVFRTYHAFYDANHQVLDALSEKARQLHSDLTQAVSALAAKENDIERYLGECSTLIETQAKLEHAKREALTLQEENVALREEIAHLSDSHFDEIRAENSRLHADAEQRRARERSLREEEAAALAALAAVENDVVRLTEQLADTQAQHESTQAQHESNRREKERLLQELETFRQRIDDYRQWLAGWPQVSQELRDDYDRLNAQAMALLLAWNAENAQALPRTAITDFPALQRALEGKAEDMRAALRETEEQLADMQAKMGELIEKSEKITRKE